MRSIRSRWFPSNDGRMMFEYHQTCAGSLDANWGWNGKIKGVSFFRTISINGRFTSVSSVLGDPRNLKKELVKRSLKSKVEGLFPSFLIFFLPIHTIYLDSTRMVLRAHRITVEIDFD